MVFLSNTPPVSSDALGSPYPRMLREALALCGFFRAPGTLGAVYLLFLHLGEIALSQMALW